MDARLEADLAAMHAAHERLEVRLRDLDDATARGASRLPGWSVGHVVTHLARNADSFTRRLSGCARGEVVDQYPGGAAGREAEIESGAERPASELRDDATGSHARLAAAVAAMPDDAWENLSRDVGGAERAARELPARRWREVELHHVDLGLGYEPSDWPAAFVEQTLPRALADVGRRLPGLDGVDPATVLAWTYGRAEPPDGLPELLPF